MTSSGDSAAAGAPPSAGPDAAASSDRSWRTFLRLVRPYRWHLVAGALLGITATLTGLWTPRIVESVIDHLAAGASVTGDITLFAVLTVVGLTAALLQWGMLASAGESVVFDVRKTVVTRLLRGHVPAITARPTADLVARVTADAPLLWAPVGSGFVSFVTAATGVIGAIVLMGVLDTLLLGITLGGLVVLGVVMALVMPVVGRERSRAQEEVGSLSAELDTSVRSLRTIKVLGAEGARVDSLLARARRVRAHDVKANLAEVALFEFATGGMNVISVVVLAVGAYRVGEGLMSVAELVAFFMYVGNFIVPLMSLADGFSSIQSGLAASKRIAEVEEIEYEEQGGAEGAPAAAARPASGVGTRPGVLPGVLPADDDAASSGAPVLELDGVVARYGDDEPDVLRGLTLSIPARGHVALVGPAGAGKSSTLALMLRFLRPRAGTVRLNGVPYDDLTFAQVRERFAFVEQDPAVLPGTIRDNLVVARPAAIDADLYAALEVVDLAGLVRELPDGLDTELVSATMTGGARQRLALARALLRDADVLLLDEVTSQVSARTETAIHAAIAKAAERTAVVTIAHRIGTLKDADLIVVLEDGAVRASGTHAELSATDPVYQELTGALRINDGA